MQIVQYIDIKHGHCLVFAKSMASWTISLKINHSRGTLERI